MAKKFIKNLGNIIHQENQVLQHDELEESLKKYVIALPKGTLRSKLNTNFKSYLALLEKKLEKLSEQDADRKCERKSDSLELTDLGGRMDCDEHAGNKMVPIFNLFNKSEVNLPKEEDLKEFNDEQKKHIYTLFLSRLMKMPCVVDKLLYQNVVKRLQPLVPQMASSDKSQFDWLPVMSHVMKLTSRACPLSIIRVLTLLLDAVTPDAINCIEKEKINRSGKLAAVLKNFLTVCKMSTDHTRMTVAEERQYCPLVTTLLMYLLDLSCVHSKKMGKKKAFGRQLCGFVSYLLQPWPERLLEVVLESETIEEETTHVVLPLVRQCLTLKPVGGKDPSYYLKYILLVRKVKDKLGSHDTLDQYTVLANNIPAPNNFLDWLADHCPEALSELPVEDRKFRKAKITRFILREADEELLEVLKETCQSPDIDAVINDDTDKFRDEDDDIKDEDQEGDTDIFYISKEKDQAQIKQSVDKDQTSNNKSPNKELSKNNKEAEVDQILSKKAADKGQLEVISIVSDTDSESDTEGNEMSELVGDQADERIPADKNVTLTSRVVELAEQDKDELRLVLSETEDEETKSQLDRLDDSEIFVSQKKKTTVVPDLKSVEQKFIGKALKSKTPKKAEAEAKKLQRDSDGSAKFSDVDNSEKEDDIVRGGRTKSTEDIATIVQDVVKKIQTAKPKQKKSADDSKMFTDEDSIESTENDESQDEVLVTSVKVKTPSRKTPQKHGSSSSEQVLSAKKSDKKKAKKSVDDNDELMGDIGLEDDAGRKEKITPKKADSVQLPENDSQSDSSQKIKTPTRKTPQKRGSSSSQLELSAKKNDLKNTNEKITPKKTEDSVGEDSGSQDDSSKKIKSPGMKTPQRRNSSGQQGLSAKKGKKSPKVDNMSDAEDKEIDAGSPDIVEKEKENATPKRRGSSNQQESSAKKSLKSKSPKPTEGSDEETNLFVMDEKIPRKLTPQKMTELLKEVKSDNGNSEEIINIAMSDVDSIDEEISFKDNSKPESIQASERAKPDKVPLEMVASPKRAKSEKVVNADDTSKPRRKSLDKKMETKPSETVKEIIAIDDSSENETVEIEAAEEQTIGGKRRSLQQSGSDHESVDIKDSAGTPNKSVNGEVGKDGGCSIPGKEVLANSAKKAREALQSPTVTKFATDDAEDFVPSSQSKKRKTPSKSPVVRKAKTGSSGSEPEEVVPDIGKYIKDKSDGDEQEKDLPTPKKTIGVGRSPRQGLQKSTDVETLDLKAAEASKKSLNEEKEPKPSKSPKKEKVRSPVSEPEDVLKGKSEDEEEEVEETASKETKSPHIPKAATEPINVGRRRSLRARGYESSDVESVDLKIDATGPSQRKQRRSVTKVKVVEPVSSPRSTRARDSDKSETDQSDFESRPRRKSLGARMAAIKETPSEPKVRKLSASTTKKNVPKETVARSTQRKRRLSMSQVDSDNTEVDSTDTERTKKKPGVAPEEVKDGAGTTKTKRQPKSRQSLQTTEAEQTPSRRSTRKK